MEKRKLSFWEIWNMSFGFLGIQMGFALQNANASRILQTFGADVHELNFRIKGVRKRYLLIKIPF